MEALLLLVLFASPAACSDASQFAALAAVADAPCSSTPPRGPGAGNRDPLPASPQGQVLVLDANLKEAFEVEDVADPSDMRAFARRLRRQLPYAPDVLTLQEVNGIAADNVARILSKELGANYAVIVRPNDDPQFPGGSRDTAILINTETMERGVKNGAPDPGGFVRSAHPEKAKDHAFASVREKGDDRTRLAVTSAHLLPPNYFADEESGFRAKARMSRRLAKHLEERYPNKDGHVIAGDFNNRRCADARREKADCETTPFWNALRREGFDDSIFETYGANHCLKKRIDYVFTRGLNIVDAGVDSTYDPDEDRFYSDHRFQWTLIEPKD